MNHSEMVRQALRIYFAQTYEKAPDQASRELRPSLKSTGVTEGTAHDWYKEQRRKNKQLPGAGCA